MHLLRQCQEFEQGPQRSFFREPQPETTLALELKTREKEKRDVPTGLQFDPAYRSHRGEYSSKKKGGRELEGHRIARRRTQAWRVELDVAVNRATTREDHPITGDN